MIGHGRRDSGPVDSSRRANDEKTKHAGEIAGAQEQENSVEGAGNGARPPRDEAAVLRSTQI